MRAVPLPPGQHEIHMRFVYKPFWWGLYIALGFLVVMVGLVHIFRNKLQNLLWPDKDRPLDEGVMITKSCLTGYPIR